MAGPRLGGGMSFFAMTILIIFSGLMLIAYFSIVTQDLVFTHTFLAPSNIPYFDSTGGSGHPSLLQVQRFRFEWWVFATDSLRIVPPLAALLYQVYCILYGSGGTFIYIFVQVIFVLLELAKLGYRSWEYANCGRYQFCRNWDPSGTASTANWIWVVLFFFNLGFFFLFVIYAALGSTISQSGSERIYDAVPVPYNPASSQPPKVQSRMKNKVIYRERV